MEIDKDRAMRLFKFQSREIIDGLMDLNDMTREQATRFWYTSKTKDYIEQHNLCWISPARLYDELILEKQNSPYWMLGPF